MWNDKLVVGSALGFLTMAVLLVARVSSPVAGGSEPLSRASQETGPQGAVGGCSAGDMTMTLEIRSPSLRQRRTGGWYSATTSTPTATVVMTNVSGRRCLGGAGAWDFKIFGRGGQTVGDWGNSGWFSGGYDPGGSKTFTLPTVFQCDRGLRPFTAVAHAAIGGRSYAVQRGNLGLRDITCVRKNRRG